MTEDDSRLVSAAATSFEVLEAVRELDGAGVSAIARHLDRSKSGVFKHVKTLAAGGTSSSRATSTTSASEPGRSGLIRSTGSPRRTAKGRRQPGRFRRPDGGPGPVRGGNGSRHLREQRGVHGGCRPRQGTRNRSRDGRWQGHPGVRGRSGPERVLEGDRTSSTGETVTDPDALRTELEAVRQHRTAVDREEYVEGVECVAAPIVRSPGDPVRRHRDFGDDRRPRRHPIEEGTQGLLVSASRSVENAMGREATTDVR